MRRFLFFSWDEWEDLPGYQQRAYLEQLEKFKPWTSDGGDQEQSGRSGGGGTRDVDIEGDMSGLGFS